MATHTATLLIDCPDRPGLIAEVTGVVGALGGNIIDADQHTDAESGRFFMRLAIERNGVDRPALESGVAMIAEQRAMRWRLDWRDSAPRIAVLVSRQGHCLADLLFRWRTGELDGEIALVIGNHDDHRALVESAEIPFHHLPVTPATKPQQEARIEELLDKHGIGCVVLARYMQILSEDFVARWSERIINIHHSFLPAFAGARPYHRAFDRGVKIIGATSHYVTGDLDEGPIIAQATTSVGHRDTIDDLIRKGRDLERIVLADAVRAHLQDRILVSGNKTVVFE
ncbi:MAG: formyltetrahydrofolate deformylase [Phycisphaeraceae bacterium]|nr:formyltetrahydrofolate deformylase [Phycisphaeraceae bacterium]MCB9847725.1 formyltetrahydrofolate deformylase [Phycisphaeraceae bacterium]